MHYFGFNGCIWHQKVQIMEKMIPKRYNIYYFLIAFIDTLFCNGFLTCDFYKFRFAIMENCKIVEAGFQK